MANPPRPRATDRESDTENLADRLLRLEDWRRQAEPRLDTLQIRHEVLIGAEPGDGSDRQLVLARETRDAVKILEAMGKARKRRNALFWKVLKWSAAAVGTMLVPVLSKAAQDWLRVVLPSMAHLLGGGPK